MLSNNIRTGGMSCFLGIFHYIDLSRIDSVPKYFLMFSMSHVTLNCSLENRKNTLL